jgi:hypothetical protein
MAFNVFISYRQSDSAGYAGRIHDHLQQALGRNCVFMDVNIPPGVDFVARLEKEVAKCDVLLALIGPNWLIDRAGKRLIDNEKDFPRMEIALALKRNIPVVPVVFDNQKVPTADELPKDLKQLAVLNGFDVRHASFLRDVNELTRKIGRYDHRVEQESQDDERPKYGATISSEVASMLVGLLAGFFLSFVVMFPFSKILMAAGSEGAKVVAYGAIGGMIFVLIPAFLYLRSRLLKMHGIFAYGVVSTACIFVYLIASYFAGSSATQSKTIFISVFLLLSGSLSALLMLRLKHRQPSISS